MKLTVAVLVHNGAPVIARTLKELSNQDGIDDVETLVVCNGCNDSSTEVAREAAKRFASVHARYEVLDLPPVGRAGALNVVRRRCRGGLLILDQDTILSRGALVAIVDAFEQGYCFATLRPTLTRSLSPMVRAYYRFWTQSVYVQRSPATIGLYAVSRDGLARLPAFPPIHSDDKFARMHFKPSECVRIEHKWYRVTAQDDLFSLVRDRSRYTQGNREVARILANAAPLDAKRRVREEIRVPLSRLGDGVAFGVVLTLSMLHQQLDTALRILRRVAIARKFRAE